LPLGTSGINFLRSGFFFDEKRNETKLKLKKSGRLKIRIYNAGLIFFDIKHE
jgi:hypothetical protein